MAQTGPVTVNRALIIESEVLGACSTWVLIIDESPALTRRRGDSRLRSCSGPCDHVELTPY
jgi:hypothetical protein